MMNKEKRYFSASDVNKFVYCQYQWYYEKIYGSNEIRRIAKESGELNTNINANFKRGTNYHKKALHNEQIKQKVVATFFVALIIFVAACLYFICR